MKKILFVSGTRADYGHLKKLILLFKEDSSFITFVAATGTHLSEKHGRTIEILKADGMPNIVEVDLKISGDTPSDICRAISCGVSEFSHVFQEVRPDLIVVLGDRYELWPACMSAVIHNIPIAHIHGGESTEGVIDEAIRHSITKMSHVHFCSHPLYQRRIIRMGENPKYVHLVGAPGLDRIKEMNFSKKEEIEKALKVEFSSQNILCTFHPVTLDKNQSNLEISNLIESISLILANKPDLKFIITLPNSDTYSSYIHDQWNALVKIYPKNVHTFTNLGDQLYLSVMKLADLVLGNSSSGIAEAPFLNKAVVDIGYRQAGRLKSPHILHSSGETQDLVGKINVALSPQFQKSLASHLSIYGDGNSSLKIYDILRNINIAELNFKKFFDGDT
ncbi:MAG: UDP-N-acetylglucosamine 2-epimerase [Bacteriovorax sp.]|jgi:UDP-hydrolysing UDP-N-acetyl-D-glucosamine 2-epimerase